MKPDRIWDRGDALVAAVAGILSFAVYLWTVAPNVTLLDSGEFIVAAQHFGVPHPTGYPLWTLLAWLFQLLPLGNAAWEINLFSAVCSALSAALMAALSRSSLRWMLGDRLEGFSGLNSLVSVSTALLFAFSFSVWSQAVIAEVYGLHVLLIGGYLAAIYVWIRRPESLGLLIFPFFVLALAFSNHHLSVAMAPLPFLAVLLVRRTILWDLLAAAFLTVLLAYLGFAILSNQPPVLKTAIRFFYVVFLGLAVLVFVRRGRLEWRLIAYLPFAVAFGLLPYAYMPLASSTNPPMNWAYTRTAEGFYYSFNRSQYQGSLDQQSMRSLGRLMGTHQKEPETPDSQPAEDSLVKRLQDWTGFFWLQLARSFTPLGLIAYFVAFLVILRLRDVGSRTWVYVLEIGFVLAAILQPVADKATIDNAGWWLQMPYHTYTNFFFGLLVGLGFVVGGLWLFRRFPRLVWMRFGLLALPLVPLWLNYDGCSQRDRWFGWQFGHDMLKDLPRDSVVFGGTDPGRFVPTYMILGESPQPPHVKRDPGFDRRDLYIITQNGVGEPLYRRYLEDHYGPNRPKVANAFERWLGRETIYPKKPLVFPTEQEIEAAIREEAKKSKDSQWDPFLPHSVVTRLIWDKNRDQHEFFVEESYPLEWSYDHAMPNGLSYRILREPVKEIPADVVAADIAFWQDYAGRLLNNPDYLKDFDAQRSFSKLRTTTGHIYRHRKMMKEAETAYRQALALWTANMEVLVALSDILWERRAFDEFIQLVSAANEADPNSTSLWKLRAIAEKRKEFDGKIEATRRTLASEPANAKAAMELLGLYAATGNTNAGAEFLTEAMKTFTNNPDVLRSGLGFAISHDLKELEFEAAKRLAHAEPEDAEAQLTLAAAAARVPDRDVLFEAARRAVELDGEPMRRALGESPAFKDFTNDPDFLTIIGKPIPPPPSPSPAP